MKHLLRESRQGVRILSVTIMDAQVRPTAIRRSGRFSLAAPAERQIGRVLRAAIRLKDRRRRQLLPAIFCERGQVLALALEGRNGVEVGLQEGCPVDAALSMLMD